MMNFNDMFKPQDVKALEKADKQVEEKLSMTGAVARYCLNSSSFQKYRRQYQSAEEKMIQAMMMCTESYMAGRFDLTSYGSKMLVYITRLKALRSLLDTVTLDSKKGKPDEQPE